MLQNHQSDRATESPEVTWSDSLFSVCSVSHIIIVASTGDSVDLYHTSTFQDQLEAVGVFITLKH